MKIYTQTFDVAKQSPQRFWVAPFSDFKIGVKIVKNGTPIANEFTVKKNGVALEADEDKVDGFTTFTLQSSGTGNVEYAIEVSGVGETMKLVQIVTDSTVFEVGGVTEDWVEDYVFAQTSAFIDETALAPYATTSAVESAISTATTDMATQTWVGQQGYASQNDLSIYATTSAMESYVSTATSNKVTGGAVGLAPVLSNAVAVYASVWASMSASADANTLYVVLSDPS